MIDVDGVDSHTRIILERYKDGKKLSVHHIADKYRQVLVKNSYISKAAEPAEFRGKVILELGAGCSSYIPVFLDYGCKTYYANDIIPERLAASRVNDPRYHELPGDFREIELPEPIDIVFASLTMMFLQPMLGEVVKKIGDSLRPGDFFLGFDPNYVCPLSIYRRFADRGANPARVFSPFGYARTFRRYGFSVEKLVPLTTAYPWTVGNWLAGTSFWMRARKL